MDTVKMCPYSGINVCPLEGGGVCPDGVNNNCEIVYIETSQGWANIGKSGLFASPIKCEGDIPCTITYKTKDYRELIKGKNKL